MKNKKKRIISPSSKNLQYEDGGAIGNMVPYIGTANNVFTSVDELTNGNPYDDGTGIGRSIGTAGDITASILTGGAYSGSFLGGIGSQIGGKFNKDRNTANSYFNPIPNVNPLGTLPVAEFGFNMDSPQLVNIEKGELLVDPTTGDILQDFDSPRYSAHSKSKKKEDPNNFVTANTGLVIPKRYAKQYKENPEFQMGIIRNVNNKFEDRMLYGKDSDGNIQEYSEIPFVEMAKSGININPKNKGKFTEWAKSKGMSVQEAASKVMANPDEYSSTIVKRANFARNAKKFKHANGGPIKPQSPVILPEEDIQYPFVSSYLYGNPNYDFVRSPYNEYPYMPNDSASVTDWNPEASLVDNNTYQPLYKANQFKKIPSYQVPKFEDPQPINVNSSDLPANNVTSPNQDYSMPVGSYLGLASNVVGALGPLATTLANGIDRDETNQFFDIERQSVNAYQPIINRGRQNTSNQLRLSANAAMNQNRNSSSSYSTMSARNAAVNNQYQRNLLTSNIGYDTNEAQYLSNIIMQGNQLDAQGETMRQDRLDRNRDNYYSNLSDNLSNVANNMGWAGANLNKEAGNKTKLNILKQVSPYFDINRKGEITYKGQVIR
jgi:hypothetical protein